MESQVVAGLEGGTLVAERPDATPNPTVEVRESLPDGVMASESVEMVNDLRLGGSLAAALGLAFQTTF